MNCRRARAAILRRIDGTLGLERGFELDAHLERCDGCMRAWDRGQELEEGLARLPEPPLHALDVEAALARIRERQPVVQQIPNQLRSWPRFALPLAAAALIACGILWKGTPTAIEEAEVASTQQEPTQQPVTPRPIEPTHSRPLAHPESPSPLDDDLLQRAREEVRQTLLAVAIPYRSGEIDLVAFAELFDQQTVALRRMQWPVLRLVEHALGDPDPLLASAAARYLGLEGDRSSLKKLQKALDREEIAGEVTLAFADARVPGEVGLGLALALPAQRELACELLIRRGSASASQILAQAMASEHLEQAQLSRESDLLVSMVAMGEVSLPALFDLGQQSVLDIDQLCAALEDIPTAAMVLADSLPSRTPATRKGREDLLLRLRCARRIAPVAACDWMLAHIHENNWTEFVLQELPKLRDRSLVNAIVKLDGDSRLATDDLDQMVREALEENPLVFLQAIRVPAQTLSEPWLHTLGERLIAAETPLAVPGVRLLLDSRPLTPELQADLVDLLAEYGSHEDLPQIATLFAACGEYERSLAAHCLIALERLGGESAVLAALGQNPAQQLSSYPKRESAAAHKQAHSTLLQLLRRRKAGKRTTPSIYKLARELRPILSARALTTTETSL